MTLLAESEERGSEHLLPSPLYLIDDDVIYRERLAQSLRSRGFHTCIISDPRVIAHRGLPTASGCAIVDLRMPSVSGLDVVSSIKSSNPDVRIVVVTGFGSIASAVEAMRRGALSYLTKPVGINDILAALNAPENGPLSVPPAPTASLARVEWEHIQSVLTRCDGNISKTAKELGLHRRSLQRKLREPPAD